MNIKNKCVATLAVAMLLTGCSSQGGTNLASLDKDITITSNDIYAELLNNAQGKQTVFNYLVSQVVTKKYPVTEAMKKDVSLQIEQLQNQYTAYYQSNAEAELLKALNQSGFNSLDDYKETLTYSYQLRECIGTYVDAHFDEVFNEYYTTKKPRYVSHILVKMEDPENPTEAEAKKLDEVKQALQKNEQSFSVLAQTYSDDSSSTNGGSLGLCDADTQFVPEFLDAMLKLGNGEVSGEVKSQYGYHFIKVDNCDEATLKEDEEVKTKLISSNTSLLYKAIEDVKVSFKDKDIQKIYEEQLAIALPSKEKE